MAPAVEVQRVRQELKRAGVTSFGLAKFASNLLPHILHEGEHVRGVVYGRYATGTGLTRRTQGMLVATERRIIFVDRRPGSRAMDELAYEVVSGVQKSHTWPFSFLTLHAGFGYYTLGFANKKGIDIFMKYVEKRRLRETNAQAQQEKNSGAGASPIDEHALDFLTRHDTAVLSTVDRDGNAYGSMVHYLVIDNYICILTRSETRNVQNVFTHRQVALTLFDYSAMKSLQIQGAAVLEAKQSVRNRVLSELSKPRIYGEHAEYPPVAMLKAAGDYTVIRIMPYDVRFLEFRRLHRTMSGRSSGGEKVVL